MGSFPATNDRQIDKYLRTRHPDGIKLHLTKIPWVKVNNNPIALGQARWSLIGSSSGTSQLRI